MKMEERPLTALFFAAATMLLLQVVSSREADSQDARISKLTDLPAVRIKITLYLRRLRAARGNEIERF